VTEPRLSGVVQLPASVVQPSHLKPDRLSWYSTLLPNQTNIFATNVDILRSSSRIGCPKHA